MTSCVPRGKTYSESGEKKGQIQSLLHELWKASYIHVFGSDIDVQLSDNNRQVAGETVLTKKKVSQPSSASSTLQMKGRNKTKESVTYKTSRNVKAIKFSGVGCSE
jgi:hypothetical protein